METKERPVLGLEDRIVILENTVTKLVDAFNKAGIEIDDTEDTAG